MELRKGKNHTHFVLVPGCNWGDESLWLAHITCVLHKNCLSLTIAINGSEITWHDLFYSVQADRP
ncbi:MAG TPA: hypothetical protein V6D43_02195 [Candidatus Sericytochromatia bacterium]